MTHLHAHPLHERPRVTGFFDKRTFSVQYVVADPATMACAIIDPVLDFDPKSGATTTQSADQILRFIEHEGLRLEWILDTHPHADHFSAAGYLRDRTGAPTAIGERVRDVQKLWQGIYNIEGCCPADGSQWDRLFADGDRFRIGELDVQVMFTPGHTLASIAYAVGDAVFVHDTLFMPDSGTDETRVFTGHDYQPGGREPRWESTVGRQKRENIHLVEANTEASFVALREARDRTLAMPKLILHSLQVNIRGGRLPEPEGDGRRYLKIPLDALAGAAWDN
jgi:glyoxylase-like metal-dependent hydrolase (beta-lactamase superfamily II)